MHTHTVLVDPLERSVIVIFHGDSPVTGLLHYPNINEAIREFEVLLDTLKTQIPLEDMSTVDVRDMIDAVTGHLSLPLNNLVRMKWVKSSANYHVYGDCGYADKLTSKSQRRMGTTRIRKSELPEGPPEFIGIDLRPSAPMKQENQNENSLERRRSPIKDEGPGTTGPS